MWPVVALLFAAQIAGRISAEPPLSPNQVAELESVVRANPNDKDTRLRLLRHYAIAGPAQNAARIPHLLYLIEHDPSDPAVAAHSINEPIVRDAWIRVAERSPHDTGALLNAARALHSENLRDAQNLLERAVARSPDNRVVAANLGFLYAIDILGMAAPSDPERARIELDRTQNPWVLAGAGVALPNLFPRSPQARNPQPGSAFEFASNLMARARQLAPNQPELNGPMPLIREFQAFQQSEMAAIAPAPPPDPPGTIRVAPEVQAARLIEKPEPVYPAMAAQARIQGRVVFTAIINHDGGIENLTLVSGHPVLVPAATEAVRQYRYRPTLLNGAPVKVITRVEVAFTIKAAQ